MERFTFSFGAWIWSSGRPTPRNTIGAPSACWIAASGPLPPSRVGSTGNPSNAWLIASVSAP